MQINRSRFGLKTFGILAFLILVTSAQSLSVVAKTWRSDSTVTTTSIHGISPSKNAYITKYYLGEGLAPNRDNGNGCLHIIYSDKVEVIECPSEKTQTDKQKSVKDLNGFREPAMAPDRRTIAWTETFDNCATSYPIPLTLAIYQSGDKVMHIQQGQMVWYWTFINGGRQIAVVWGATHGREVGDYHLYDVETGRLLSEVFGNEVSQSLNAGAPKWAKDTESAMRRR